ncbi:hypothetical protein GQ42DRAFT_29343 [Ramicandelaber brevisporus]|nr:hypothetical protein GQ42DRAFT_29343 [Ramicandelaber brevisporus]
MSETREDRSNTGKQPAAANQKRGPERRSAGERDGARAAKHIHTHIHQATPQTPSFWQKPCISRLLQASLVCRKAVPEHHVCTLGSLCSTHLVASFNMQLTLVFRFQFSTQRLPIQRGRVTYDIECSSARERACVTAAPTASPSQTGTLPNWRPHVRSCRSYYTTSHCTQADQFIFVGLSEACVESSNGREHMHHVMPQLAV